jgi:hypothetical protein
MTGIRTSISTTSGKQLPGLADRFGSVRGLAEDLQALLSVEHGGETLPDHRLIVGDQAPGGHAISLGSAATATGELVGGPIGSRAATTNPPPGSGPADK